MPLVQTSPVTVAVRIRPPQSSKVSSCVTQSTGTTLTLTDPTAMSASLSVNVTPGVSLPPPPTSSYMRNYKFDHVFGPEADQDEVNESLGLTVLRNAWEGRNACVFAYGQTGSGKTHTMTGTHGSHSGLVKYILGGLWKANEECKNEARATAEGVDATEGRIVCSYMEIYNEVVKDLLAPTDNSKVPAQPLKVREHPSEGAYVANLSYFPVNAYRDVERLLEIGAKARTTKSTKANKRSSRSHAVLTVVFEQKTTRHDQSGYLVATNTKTARVHLVDLAGSERVKQTGATGATLNEASHINKSLAALGDVIKALAKSSRLSTAPSSFVPYRNSTLTYLLKESLGGNSVTVMIATVSPSLDHFDETFSTLKYAERAKRMVNHVKMNSETIEVGSTHAEIQKLREEVQRLRSEKEEMMRALTDTPARTLQQHNQSQIDNIESQITEAVSAASEMATSHAQFRPAIRQHHDTPAPVPCSSNTVTKINQSVPTLPENIPTLVNLNPDPMFSEKIKYPIPSGVATIGSNASNDVVLRSASVAPHHCVVSYEKRTGLLMLANFEGNETYVNGKRIEATGSNIADGMRISPTLRARNTTTVTLQHGFRLCFGSSGTHVFRLEFVTSESDEKRVKADYEFAREEMRMVKKEEFRSSQHHNELQRGDQSLARNQLSPDDQLPEEFEDMFNSMTPPPHSDASSATVDNNQILYTHPHNIQNEDVVINSIASKLDTFASQLDALTEDDQNLQNSMMKLSKSQSSNARHQNSDHASPFSVCGYNPAVIEAVHATSNNNVSHTESEMEFLEYEKFLEARLSPHSDNTARSESTVVLNAEGRGAEATDELSESFAMKSRAALESLKREIEEDEFDKAIDDVFNSAPTPPPIEKPVRVTETETKREAAKLRLRNRQRTSAMKHS